MHCNGQFFKFSMRIFGEIAKTDCQEKTQQIGHFHDGVILLQLPEFISFSFSNVNFVIPVDSKEQ